MSFKSVFKTIVTYWRAKNKKKSVLKVSHRFFPVSKWTTNSWRGIKARKSCENGPENGKQKFNQARQEETAEEVPRSIVIYTEEKINIFKRDVKLSVLLLVHFISFSFATKKVKGLNYFPSRANDLKNLNKAVKYRRLVNSVKYIYYPLYSVKLV